MKKLRNIFMSGIGVLLPLALTYWVLSNVFSIANNILRAPVDWVTMELWAITIPGLGVGILILLVFLVGIITNNYIGLKLTDFVAYLVEKIPGINNVYKLFKDMVKMGTTTKSFDKVVRVEFPNKGSYSLGFLTNEESGAIFIPTTPNPSNGFLIEREKGKYKVLNMTPAEAIAQIMSMGMIRKGDIDEEEV